MTMDDIIDGIDTGILTESHTSWRRGYVSRRSEGIVKPYNGKFGQGWTVETPSWETTQYHHVTYFLGA